MALQGLLGEDAPLSDPMVAQPKEKWYAERANLARRRWIKPRSSIWVDGIYVKAGLEKDKAALLVVLTALSDGRKVALTVTPGHRESTARWAAVLHTICASGGLRPPRLVVGEGQLRMWAALRAV